MVRVRFGCFGCSFAFAVAVLCCIAHSVVVAIAFEVALKASVEQSPVA